MLSVEEAAKKLQDAITPIKQTEHIPLMDALGRVLAEAALAPFDQPPFPRSPLDGYAIRAFDSAGASRKHPIKLLVAGEICAGMVFDGILRPGQAVRIMTGAPIPKGADTVIRQENTDCGESEVQIYESLAPYGNYCPQGEDFKAGDILIPAGARIDGVALGILSSMGLSHALVYRMPRVGVVSTGDELIMPGTDRQPGKIYDSNLYLIGSRLKEIGIEPAFLCHCGDDVDAMANLIREKAGSADLILTTGGVSVGKKDIMHEVVRTVGAKRLFWKVDIKPGSPTLAACYQDTLLVCLSGNPFGAMANFELLVRPVLAALSGCADFAMAKKRASFLGKFSKKSGKRRIVRGFYEDGRVWIPEGKHASGILSSMAGCNCLIDIEQGNEGLKEGDLVWVHLM